MNVDKLVSLIVIGSFTVGLTVVAEAQDWKHPTNQNSVNANNPQGFADTYGRMGPPGAANAQALQGYNDQIARVNQAKANLDAAQKDYEAHGGTKAGEGSDHQAIDSTQDVFTSDAQKTPFTTPDLNDTAPRWKTVVGEEPMPGNAYQAAGEAFLHASTPTVMGSDAVSQRQMELDKAENPQNYPSRQQWINNEIDRSAVPGYKPENWTPNYVPTYNRTNQASKYPTTPPPSHTWAPSLPNVSMRSPVTNSTRSTGGGSSGFCTGNPCGTR